MSARTRREKAEKRAWISPFGVVQRYYAQVADDERVRDLRRLGATVVGLMFFIGLVFLVGYCQNRLK